MERIKKALEKARQERQIRVTGEPAPSRISRKATGPVEYTQTESITVDEAVLRENRIIDGLESGPYTEAYNLLRTQVLQRFKENNWNVLAVTSPGEGEGKTLTAINLAISIAREVDYTVLLVDDNPTNLEVLYQTLDGHGYRLLAARGGEAALNIVAEAQPTDQTNNHGPRQKN